MDGFNSFDDDEIELPEDSKDLEGNGELESSEDTFDDDIDGLLGNYNGEAEDGHAGEEVLYDDNGEPYYASDLVDEDETEGEESGHESLSEDKEDSAVESDEDDLDTASEDSEESLDDEEDAAEAEDDTSEDSEAKTATVRSDSFLDENGNVRVMDTEASGETFELVKLKYENLGFGKRIRTSKNVDDLTSSIRSTGLLNPIVVAPSVTEGVYVVIDGFRRILACSKVGIKEIPAIINTKLTTQEVPVVEALYNHKKPYTMQEIVDYIEYLAKEKGITDPPTVEYLLDLNNGDYSKLKDILSDNDEELVSKLLEGQLTIGEAFKRLEKRRSKESREEKDIKKAGKVYNEGGGTEESALNNSGEMADSGEESEEDKGSRLTADQIAALAVDPSKIDSEIEDKSLDEMIAESDKTEGFEPHQQKVGEREYLDPAIKKAVLARDKFTCQCCGIGKDDSESYVSVMDAHHIVPVFLGGKDTSESGVTNIDNIVTLCIICHKMVHEFSTGDLHLPRERKADEVAEMSVEEREQYKKEQTRFKKVVYFGDLIRKAMAQRGINRKEFKKQHPSNAIGRRKPGKNTPQVDI